MLKTPLNSHDLPSYVSMAKTGHTRMNDTERGQCLSGQCASRVVTAYDTVVSVSRYWHCQDACLTGRGQRG